DDQTLPDRFIVIQPGQTEEVERAGSGSVRERWTLTITPITRVRGAAAALREARLAIKAVLAGVNAGIKVSGLQQTEFMTETPMLADAGRRWSVQAMPLQVTYIQPLKQRRQSCPSTASPRRFTTPRAAAWCATPKASRRCLPPLLSMLCTTALPNPYNPNPAALRHPLPL